MKVGESVCIVINILTINFTRNYQVFPECIFLCSGGFLQRLSPFDIFFPEYFVDDAFSKITLDAFDGSLRKSMIDL